MDIVVPIKFVPDLVEELEIDEDTGLLDRMFLRMIPNELDEHALEQAIILKERHGGSVTVITLDTGDVLDHQVLRVTSVLCHFGIRDIFHILR